MPRQSQAGRPKPKESWSENDIAGVLTMLQVCGGNVSECSRRSGVPGTTIRDWRDGKRMNAGLAEKCGHKKVELTELFQSAVEALVGAIIPRIEDANLRDVATAAGILTDKLQLLKGEATSRTENVSITDSDRASRVEELLERGRAARVGLTAVSGVDGQQPAIN